MESFDRLLRDSIQSEQGEARYLDLCLVLRRESTKEILLWAGDRWDRLERRFTSAALNPLVIDVEESQVEFVRWFALWLAAYRERRPREISLVLNEGDRRGGKTTISTLCLIAALIDVPETAGSRALGWLVSETFKKRDELEETISRFIPSRLGWYKHWRAPEFRYEFASGAVLRNLSAQDPEDMRQGRADLICYNEPQQMVAQAVVNGLFGTADKAGLTILACNPPTQIKGEWLVDLKEAIDRGDAEGAITFHFSSKLNKKIDQPARGRIGKLARIINPKQVASDDEGIWARIGDRAYPRFTKDLLRPLPLDGDITTETIYRRCGFRGYSYLGGADFQGWPFNAVVLWKIFGSDDGKLIYHAADEFLVDGAEIHLLSDIREAGYQTNDILFIGDASGQWQNYRHEEGYRSFQEFKKDGWVIRPPRDKKPDAKSENVGNPPVEQRMRVMLTLMEQGRILIDPDRCPHLAESYKECPLKKEGARIKKFGRHAHETDAADYPLYWIEPKPRSIVRTSRMDVFSVPLIRRGADVI